MQRGTAHAQGDENPYSVLAMGPPHLVLKWAGEVLVTVPLARTFVVYDLRNGGDSSKPHGIVEVSLRNGHAVAKGLKSSVSALRKMGRKGWRKLCPGPAYFIGSKETGKLSYFWKHAYNEAKSGCARNCVTNPDTGSVIPNPKRDPLIKIDFVEVKHSEKITRSSNGTSNY